MGGFTRFLEEKVMPVAAKIAAQRHLQALRDGLVLTMPLIIAGSLFLVIRWLPFDSWLDYMGSDKNLWGERLSYPVGATFDLIALIACFGIAYRLAEKYAVDALSAGAVAVSAFLLTTPFSTTITVEGVKEAVNVGGVVPTTYLGAGGLFVAILIALLSTEVYRFIIQKKITIKMPDGVPPSVSKAFIALIPAFFVITIFWLVKIFFEGTDWGNIHAAFKDIIGGPLENLGGSLGGTLVAVMAIQLLWSCGLHGASIVGGIMGPIWLKFTADNLAAYEAGKEIPNVISQQFIDLFVYIGGSGATLALVFAMIFFAKSKQMKTLGKLALPSGIFNINEPITFGMPIVMNPIMMIPFILTPIAMTIATYIGMETGFAPKTAGIALPWTMPVGFGGYMVTGNKIMGAVMQLINFGIAFVIYFPFFKMWDNVKYKEEQAAK
ncbi:MAG: cellobiose transporter subunit [Bacillales bacterium]|jgi:PTS system cellobiose-specific IIC component|nr:cellobiose transporter subunit [Bacillales bacterium]